MIYITNWLLVDMKKRFKVAFFEMQGWEKALMKKGLKGHSLSFFGETLTSENAKKASNADVVSVFVNSKVDGKALKQLKKVKLIATRSTGFDHIDLRVCKRRKIAVYNRPVYGENTVAEHTFALILALSRKVHESHVRRLKGDFSIEGLRGFDLAGKTLGVIGAGNIGKHVIRIARGFEMKVLVYDRHPDKFLAEEMNFKYVQLKGLLKKSDIVTLHIPYMKTNHHFIDKNKLKMMKRGAVLINTARGEIVDTEALIWALDKKILSGAGLDVIEGEKLIKEEKELIYDPKKIEDLQQLAEGHALLARHDVVYTPHIAFYSKEALERIIVNTIEDIKNFSEGKVNENCVVC